jgi:hypothetical protein
VVPTLWIAQLIVSDRTAAKLASVHGLDHREVSAAIVGTRNLRYMWHDDPQRGRRAVVEALVEGRVCIIVLNPVNHPLGGVFALGSAYPR